MNYADASFQNERHIAEFSALNEEISAMYKEIKEILYPQCEIKFITPSIYEQPLNI